VIVTPFEVVREPGLPSLTRFGKQLFAVGSYNCSPKSQDVCRHLHLIWLGLAEWALL
jgi:hypothetical protein